jgi:hypothetical protein
MKSDKRYWLDDSRNIDRIFYGISWICVLLTLSDLFYHKQGHLPWEDWFGFYGLYGFISCVGLVLLAKQLRKVLGRKEGYYDR